MSWFHMIPDSWIIGILTSLIGTLIFSFFALGIKISKKPFRNYLKKYQSTLQEICYNINSSDLNEKLDSTFFIIFRILTYLMLAGFFLFSFFILHFKIILFFIFISIISALVWVFRYTKYHSSTHLEIIEAIYKSITSEKFADVKEILKNKIDVGKLDIFVGNELFGDPAYHETKELIIRYKLNGNEYPELKFGEHSRMLLPDKNLKPISAS